jgi:hypothetical protein
VHVFRRAGTPDGRLRLSGGDQQNHNKPNNKTKTNNHNNNNKVAAARRAGTLRRPLRAKFAGEDGVDEGGVQRELFALLLRQALEPALGRFAADADSRLHWFAATPPAAGAENDDDDELELIGVLIGACVCGGLGRET